jgi:hypothetical protein
MNITIQEARPRFTKGLHQTWIEQVRPTGFLQSFFTVVTSDTKEISIEVERANELMAVDVLRGTEGNRNVFGKSTEKIFVPPYYREFFDATDLDLYDKTFGSVGATIDSRTLARFTKSVAGKFNKLVDKIDRRKEFNCAQVFETGIVTLQNGDNIDFKRKAASKINVDTLGSFWGEVGADPIADLELAGDFMRSVGKVQGSQTLVAILGAKAMEALLRDEIVKDRLNFRRADLASINSPQVNAAGGKFHGLITAGGYEFELWTYTEVFDDANKVSTLYWPTNFIAILPKSAEFIMSHAAVPKLLTDKAGFAQAIANVRGTETFGNRIDEAGEKHIMDVKSAFVPIPVSVDRIYTMQVLATV